jgi:hypothetical protein
MTLSSCGEARHIDLRGQPSCERVATLVNVALTIAQEAWGRTGTPRDARWSYTLISARPLVDCAPRVKSEAEEEHYSIVNAGDWIAGASAVVAAVGAFVAWRQAGLAKRAAQTADRQAAAAEEQVAIMQKQRENETTDRHEAAAPRLTVKSPVLEDDRHGQPVALLTVEQAGGVAVSEVEVAARQEGGVHGLLVNPHAFEPDYATGPVLWKGSAEGMEHPLTVSLEYNFVEPVNVALDFVSRQAETGREWKCTLMAVPRRPRPPRRIRGAS